MTPPQVMLYGRAACPPCHRTKKKLEDAGVPLSYVDVDHDQAALDGLSELEWVTALPVVVTADLKWCGYRPEHIKTICARYGAS